MRITKNSSTDLLEKVKELWATREGGTWAWFSYKRCNMDDEYRGMYPTREVALLHKPEGFARLHRLHPFREWIPEKAWTEPWPGFKD